MPTGFYRPEQQAVPSVNATNILSPICLYDSNAIRRVVNHIRALRQPMYQPGTASLPGLNEIEQTVVSRVKDALSRSLSTSLFAMVCDKFADAFACRDEVILDAARDFDLLAIDAVTDPKPETKSEYDLAKRAFELMQCAGNFGYDNQSVTRMVRKSSETEVKEGNQDIRDGLPSPIGETSSNPFAVFERGEDGFSGWPQVESMQLVLHGDKINEIESERGYGFSNRDINENISHLYGNNFASGMNSFDDGDEERSTTLVGVDDSVEFGSIYEEGEMGLLDNTYPDPDNTHGGFFDHDESPVKPNNLSGEETLAEEDNDYDDSDSEDFQEQQQDSLLISALKAANKRSRGTQKHKAVRKRGDIPYNDGSCDRDPAKKDCPDPSKCRIAIPTRKIDPRNPLRFIRSDDAIHVYGHAVDWTCKESVATLNQWRCQVFRRNFGVKRLGRAVWTKREHDALKVLLKEYAARANVRNRWSRLDWNSIAADFNEQFNGCVFPVGEPAYGPKKLDFTLDKELEFRGRTAAAIKGQINAFTDPQTRDFVKALKDLDEQDRLAGPDGGHVLAAAATATIARGTKRKATEDVPPAKKIRLTISTAKSIDTAFTASDARKKSRARKSKATKTQAKGLSAPRANEVMLEAPTSGHPNVMPVANMGNGPKTFLFHHVPEQMFKQTSSFNNINSSARFASSNVNANMISPPFNDDSTEDEASPLHFQKEHPFKKLLREKRMSQDTSSRDVPSSALHLSPFRDISAFHMSY